MRSQNSRMDHLPKARSSPWVPHCSVAPLFSYETYLSLIEIEIHTNSKAEESSTNPESGNVAPNPERSHLKKAALQLRSRGPSAHKPMLWSKRVKQKHALRLENHTCIECEMYTCKHHHTCMSHIVSREKIPSFGEIQYQLEFGRPKDNSRFKRLGYRVECFWPCAALKRAARPRKALITRGGQKSELGAQTWWRKSCMQLVGMSRTVRRAKIPSFGEIQYQLEVGRPKDISGFQRL